jgi:hypothetical protein
MNLKRIRSTRSTLSSSAIFLRDISYGKIWWRAYEQQFTLSFNCIPAHCLLLPHPLMMFHISVFFSPTSGSFDEWNWFDCHDFSPLANQPTVQPLPWLPLFFSENRTDPNEKVHNCHNKFQNTLIVTIVLSHANSYKSNSFFRRIRLLWKFKFSS